MTPNLTVETITEAMKGNDFWMNGESDAAKVVAEAARRGFIKRLSHTQAQWTEAGLTKARAELGVTTPNRPMSDIASRYAEKTQATLKALADNEDAHTAALRRHDMEEVNRLRLEAVGLVAVLRLRAADLVDVTLRAAPAPLPALALAAPARCDHVLFCGGAYRKCILVSGHEGDHVVAYSLDRVTHAPGDCQPPDSDWGAEG